MTAPVTDPPTGGLEAPCSDCIVNKGLCRFHERHELPQLKEPSWPHMIGDPYVCSEARCEEHVRCIHTLGPTPRGECSCHNCSQKRWARARAATAEEPSVAAVKARRRNERKRDRAAGRLVSAMHGGFSRSRSSNERQSKNPRVALTPRRPHPLNFDHEAA